MVWQPDIVLLNNADGNYEVIYQANINIQTDGLVTWIPPAIYQSTCPIDVRYFPFDQQTCKMKFASWTFAANEACIYRNLRTKYLIIFRSSLNRILFRYSLQYGDA